MRKKKKSHKLGGIIAALGIVLSLSIPVQAAVTQADLAKPVVDKTTHNQKGPGKSYRGTHSTSYHYVYFGNYPQREIKGAELTDEIINVAYDQYGNGEVNGKKIRRLSKELITTYGTINDATWRFTQQSTNGYRYYLYEPIKWKIYDNDGSTLFLVSDKEIEQQMFSAHSVNLWADCDLRKWLNYDGGEPQVEIGKGFKYKNPGFMYYAFSDEEKGRIKVTQVKQDSNPIEQEDGTYLSSGPDTEDKIFILSRSELGNLDYGTCDDHGYGCKAAVVYNTDYSRSMNGRDYYTESECLYKYHGDYWLRTVGAPEELSFPGPKAMYVDGSGATTYGGNEPYMDAYHVVPALNANYTLNDCIRISFQTNTSANIEDQVLLGSNYAVEPDALTQSGYEFTGWYLDEDCTRQYLFNQKLTADTTLYAGWKQQAIPDAAAQKAEKTAFSDGKASYKVTKAKTTVEYVAPVSKTAKTVTIPATVSMDGITYKVTSIAKNAFKKNTKLKTIKIGSNVTTIGDGAFYGCTNLTTVTIGKNVKTIGSNAFYGCKKLKTVSMGSSVTTIGAKAFYKCTALTRITLPSKVNKIGKQAFYGCTKLKNITIKTKKLTSKKVGSKTFGKTYAKAVVKVPKSKVKAYKKFLYKKGLNKKAKIKK